MKNRIYSIDQNNQELVNLLAGALGGQVSDVELRRFPDGESYLRVMDSCEGVDAIVVCSLQQPDEKILPLLFLADTLKELGAASVGLVAPYLCYMRQDIRFKPGEAISSRTFASLISQKFDWLVTVDPHLHRYNRLDEIYSIPDRIVSSAPAIASWLANKVEKPLLVGPDSESDQWLSEISGLSGIPYLCLEKERSGDRQVKITSDKLAPWSDHHPILIDDIISSGHTMLETIKYLQQAGMNAPLCIGIHALFGEQTYKSLQASGAKVISCNTVSHTSNKIDVNPAIVTQVAAMKAHKDS